MHNSPALLSIIILLAAAVLAVPLARRIRLGSVIGYLAAGAVVGPWGFQLIVEVEQIRRLAEFGVIFLLFVIGVDLKPQRLWIMRRMIFGLGSLQMLTTGGALIGIALLLDVPLNAAIVVGFGLALSSTAFGLQILSDKGELPSRYGRASFSILLLQDLAVVPLLALIPLLAPRGETVTAPLGLAAVKTVIIVGGVIVLGIFLLRPVLRLIATSRSSEVFTAAAMLLVLGAAYLMEAFGLSMGLGAFLAGLLISNTEYRHQVEADIQPFRGFLLGLFFMAVGMSIDLGLIVSLGSLIAALVVGLLVVKGGILWVLARLWGFGSANALRIAVLLGQGGEFAFVLFGVASGTGVIDDGLFQILQVVVALTMAATPLLVAAGHWFAVHVTKDVEHHDIVDGHIEEIAGHVIIAGFGRVGQTVAEMLHRKGVPYTALDLEPDRISYKRKEGVPIYFGDASRPEVLRAAGAAKASLMVITLDAPDAAERAVAVAHQHYPDLPIYARARDLESGLALETLGATNTIPETLEGSLQLGTAALMTLGFSEDEAVHIADELRRDHYLRLQQIASDEQGEPTNDENGDARPN